MLDVASKAFFHTLSYSQILKRLASRYGMSGQHAFARRFIAGETVGDAIAAVRHIESQGLFSTLDYLGESVTSLAAADTATREYLQLMGAVDRADVERNLSLKLTQLGLDVDRAICVDNLRKILTAAERAGTGPSPALRGGFFIRIDMESSAYTDATLDIFETVWTLGHRNVGVVLQSCLYRTEKDLERVNALGARIRLVKGAYREPKSVAYQMKSDVDAAYVRLAKRLLVEGTYPAIATHDEEILDVMKGFAAEYAIASDAYEFQMLYGIRRDLQSQYRDAGHRVRVYVPFGREWFPYFMRRLGERPANVGFVVKALFADR
jgi:proline dehydrogenase